jgi:hypothetical protein
MTAYSPKIVDAMDDLCGNPTLSDPWRHEAVRISVWQQLLNHASVITRKLETPYG